MDNKKAGMSEDIKYGLLFLGIGLLNLYIGVAWKKPSYGGGVVRKYGSICLGITLVLYSIFLLVREL